MSGIQSYKREKEMLHVKVIVLHNAMLNEKIARAQLVNQQTMTFDQFCEYIAEGSTVTAADVCAVMKHLDKILPKLLALSTKAVVSPSGITLRSAVKGSLTQSQLKEKLVARKAGLQAEGDTEAAAAIDVNRAIEPDDLTVADLTPYIEVSLPDKLSTGFQQLAVFKRVTSTSVVVEDAEDEEEDDNPGGGSGSGPGSGDNTGGNNPGSGTGGGGNDDLPMGS